MNNRRNSLPLPHPMINAFRSSVPTIEWATKFTQQHQNLKQQLKWKVIKSQLTTQKIFNSLYMKLPALTSEKSSLTSENPSSSYEQPSADIIKYPLLKSPEKSSHASQLTKHISSITLEGDTIHKIQKWWDTIFFRLLPISLHDALPISNE